MKKFISATMIATLSMALTACGSETGDVTNTESEVLKVGMTTDSGTIDDKSFNQGTWEGIELYETENPGAIEKHYVQPTGETTQDYLRAYQDLIDAGYELIISPGYKFEGAILEAQEMYPDNKFLIIDGVPNGGEATGFEPEIAENTESIFFAEQEAGFYAGIASALTSETGHVSFVGGMQIPSVQKFGWGYVAGVAYANEVYGTDVTVEDYVYAESFVDTAKGKTYAGQFYDNGSDIIFAAAGGVGIGVIEEAKTRKTAGEDVWVVGVDVDQYNDGLVGDESVVLTSAVKGLKEAAYSTIDDVINGEFKGGQSIVLGSVEGAVGLPEENPNLSEEAISAYEESKQEVIAGSVVVPQTEEELQTFLTEYNYETPEGLQY